MKTPSPVPLTPGFLAASEFFRGVPLRSLGDVTRHATVVTVTGGTRIFSQGEPAKHAHLLVRGRAKIVQTGANGEQLIVRFIRPGDTFGTVGLYVDGLYPAEAVAVESATEARWKSSVFTQLVQRHPEIALNLVRLVGARLQEVQARLREMSADPVEQRVASALLRVLLSEQEEGGGVRLPLSRRDIAELAGTTLYTASRILTAWQRQGIAASGRANLTILRPDLLARISSGDGSAGASPAEAKQARE